MKRSHDVDNIPDPKDFDDDENASPEIEPDTPDDHPDGPAPHPIRETPLGETKPTFDDPNPLDRASEIPGMDDEDEFDKLGERSATPEPDMDGEKDGPAIHPLRDTPELVLFISNLPLLTLHIIPLSTHARLPVSSTVRF